MGTHELLRILTISPTEAAEFQRSFAAFMSAVQHGDWNAAAATVLKTPTEVKAAFAGVGVGAPQAVVVTPPPVMMPSTQTSAVVSQPTAVGRYQVTG
jgi:hypothetical protein